MHLSLLSDSYISDRLDDAATVASRRAVGRTHRDGLIRGLVFTAAIAAPFGLAFASGRLDTTRGMSGPSPVVDVQAVTQAARESRPACDRQPATFGLCRRLEPL